MTWFKDSGIEEIALLDIVKKKKEGIIKLPLYQRDALWGEGRICALWDSLLRGFPLPSFLLVIGKGKATSRNFQNSHLDGRGKAVQKSEEYYDLLDGQQRMAAIDSVFTYNSDSAIRLWIDLAPSKDEHPFKFKYWIHACNKVFPFGFGLSAIGEHDFKVLSDSEITELWNEENRENALPIPSIWPASVSARI